MRIQFTPSGRDQFLRAIRFIHDENPSAALHFRKKAEVRLRRLARFPAMGRRLPEFPDIPYRELVIPPYRFFYRRVRSTVWVVGVWHGAQLPDKPGSATDL
ncbi:MAG: type II toxin-antitoxin system RelE/ParE family toxin [Deltaproteobacteria bacterium]|nr:type II toxin-antitoxin system RelE/ParE family toxin [Deltaproteobacteria bacterium]